MSNLGVIPSSQLPQMNSIWVDEDQEAEKIYGIQSEQYMTNENEGSFGFKMINSSKPLLNNKNNIKLPPLTNINTIRESKAKHKRSKSKNFLKLFNSKDNNGKKTPTSISTPFGFKHISHAGSGIGEPDNSEADLDVKYFTQQEDRPVSQQLDPPEPGHFRSLSKAFVTESIPMSTPEKFSRYTKSQRYSATSSNYSKRSGISSGSDRIVSSSTMGTSIFNEAYNSKLNGLNYIEKQYATKHMPTNSDASDISLDFLKNYTFPSVLKEEDIDFDKNSNSSIKKEIVLPNEESIESMFSTKLEITSPYSTRKRASSDPNLLATPQIENNWFENTSSPRKSLDGDILMYYLQPSGKDSPERHTSIKFSDFRQINESPLA